MACKVQVVKDIPAEARLKRELQIMKSVRNGLGVTRLLDASFNPATGKAYTYMEFFEGGDLFEFIEEVNKDNAENAVHPLLVCTILAQVAYGLSELHEKHILHRDIKANNILLSRKITRGMNRALWNLTHNSTPNPQDTSEMMDLCRILFEGDNRLAVLADFGLSRNTDDPIRADRTVKGEKRWVAWYNPPEMVAANFQFMLGDVYSFGVLVYHLCSPGHYPDSPEEFEPLDDHNGLSLQKIVDRCTSTIASQRPQPGCIVRKLVDQQSEELDMLSNKMQGFPEYTKYRAMTKSKYY